MAGVELVLVTLIISAFVAGFLPISEVPFLVGLGWLSLRYRKLRWSDLGLRRPQNGSRTTLLVLAGVAYALISLYTLDPLIDKLIGRAADLSEFANVRGNVSLLIFWIVLSWLLGAFGEELAYRGYIMNRFADLVSARRGGWSVALVSTAALFAVSHFSQGLSGIISNFLGALVYGLLYLLADKNLWVPILAHGIEDTIGFLLIFLGRYPGL